MGGGVIRAAAKTAVVGGYRSAGKLSEAVVGRRIPRPATSAAVGSAEGEIGPSISLVSSERARSDCPLSSVVVQSPSWDVDGWELLGGKEEDLFDAIHPAPRLVFGPVPTMEEAEEATSDLKEALEKTYFSSNAAEEHVNPNQETQDLKTCVNSEISPALPNHVVQAFSLLQESPEAQNVVASLASDKNVWDAIMKNDKVIEFYKTHQPVDPLKAEESIAENMPKSSESSCAETAVFSDWMLNMKQKVSDIVTNLSWLVQDFMGSSAEATDCKSRTSTSTSTDDSYVDVAKGFLALAMAAILVILLKRD